MVRKYTPETAKAAFENLIVIDPVTQCWHWQGSLRDGYGVFSNSQSPRQYAHIYAYELYRGPVPSGKVLDHIVCDTRGCCNPWHVEPSANVDNVMRGQSYMARLARQTHCKLGHELSGDNLYLYRGKRICRACHAIRSKAHRARTGYQRSKSHADYSG